TPVTVGGIGGRVTWTSSDPTVATIDENGVATGRNPGSTTITATSGGQSGSTTLTVVSGTAVRSSITVIREGTHNGSVTSSPPGTNCGAPCSASFDNGTPVPLTATPATGSTFAGWRGGGCSGTGACTVTLTTNTTVFARFARSAAPPVTLSIVSQ